MYVIKRFNPSIVWIIYYYVILILKYIINSQFNSSAWSVMHVESILFKPSCRHLLLSSDIKIMKVAENFHILLYTHSSNSNIVWHLTTFDVCVLLVLQTFSKSVPKCLPADFLSCIPAFFSIVFNRNNHPSKCPLLCQLIPSHSSMG